MKRERGEHGYLLPFPVETDEIIRLRRQEGLTWKEIGTRVGMHYSSCIHRVKNDAPITFQIIRIQPTIYERYFNYAQAHRMFFTMTYKAIAKELEVSIACVKKRVRIMRMIMACR